MFSTCLSLTITIWLSGFGLFRFKLSLILLRLFGVEFKLRLLFWIFEDNSFGNEVFDVFTLFDRFGFVFWFWTGFWDWVEVFDFYPDWFDGSLNLFISLLKSPFIFYKCLVNFFIISNYDI